MKEEKICSKCNISLPLSSFYKRTASKDGLWFECKSCAAQARKIRNTNPENKRKVAIYTRTIQRKTRDKVLELLGNKCIRCGFNDPRALQVDHIHGGGNKKDPSRGVMFYRITKGKYDITTLQLLCANCNWIKKAERAEGILADRYNV